MEDNNLFSWQKHRRTDGRTIAFLGCMTSFWGSISGHLVYALQTLNQVKCVLYIGKTGSLSMGFEPNRWLATGDCSFVDEKQVRWENVLHTAARLSPRVYSGTRVTVATSLSETQSWLEKWQSRCTWVDCEVGHMVQVANKGKTAFAYLHIVSDNVTKRYQHNLTNERSGEVIRGRQALFHDIVNILQSFLTNWSNHGSLSSTTLTVLTRHERPKSI